MKPLIIFLLCIFLLLGTASADDSQYLQAGLNENTGGTFTLPAGTYEISKQITIPKNTVLKGTVSDSGELLTTIKISDNIRLKEQESLFSALGNNEISYLKWNGNSAKQANVPKNKQGNQWGLGYHNFISIYGSADLEVHHCNFYDNLGDSIRVTNSKNIDIHHITATKGGHDVIFCLRSENIRIHDNYIQPRANSAIRLLDVNHARIYSNTIKYVRNYDGRNYDAGPSIQIQHDSGTMTDIEVCDNTIYGSFGAGFWIVGKTSGGEEAWIHHNVIYDAGSNYYISYVGGIVASGYDNLKIENNVFDGSYMAAIHFYALNAGWATKADAELSQNIFCDAVPGIYAKKGGYGICNAISKQTIDSSQNCFYENAGGDIQGACTSTANLYDNPRITDTPSGFTWVNGKWYCPSVSPSEMGEAEGVYEDLDDLTEEEIDEFEFSNIFDVLNMEFFEIAGNSTAKYSSGATITAPTKATGEIKQYIGQNITLVYVPPDNLTSIHYKQGNRKTVHTLMLGERGGFSTVYSNVSIWSGNIPRQGDSVQFDGIIEPDDIEVTCYTVKGSFNPEFSVISIEPPKSFFPPVLKFAFLILLVCFIYCRFVLRYTL